MGQTETKWVVSEYIDILRTESTKANYKIALKQFLLFFYPTELPEDKEEADKIIDELSLRYLNEDRDHSKDAASYHSSLADYAPKTQILKFGTIKAWLEVNSISINPGVLRSLNGRGGQEAISEEHIPTNVEVEKILKHLPLHGRALCLVILSGGMRPGEAHGLRFSDIDLESERTRINLKAKATKTKRRRWTYLTPQARDELQSWLGYREQFIQDHAGYGPDKEGYLKRAEGRLFPFNYKNFLKQWKVAVTKAGLLKQDEVTNRLTIHPHNLRKYFSTRGEWPDRDIASFFMGHIGGIKAVYVRYDEIEEVVWSAYERAIPSLTIGEGFGDTKAVQKLEERVESIQEDKVAVNENLNYVLKMNKLLSNEIDELKENFEDFKTILAKELAQRDNEIKDLNARFVLLSGETAETIHATEEEALADLQEKKRVKNR